MNKLPAHYEAGWANAMAKAAAFLNATAADYVQMASHHRPGSVDARQLQEKADLLRGQANHLLNIHPDPSEYR